MIQKEFISEKKYQGLTENSIQSYLDFFKVWNEWLGEQGLERMDQLNSKNSKAYLMYCMEERGNKPKTLNTKLKLMRAFARWCIEEEVLSELFTKGIRMQREDDSPKVLSEQDLKDVLSHLRRKHRRENSFTARRNYTMIVFLAGTGMRLNEMCSVTWSDIDFDNSLISIRTTKSRKLQSVPLSDSLRAELLDYKRFLERKFDTRQPPSVFCTEEGGAISKNSVQNVFKRLRSSVGLEGAFSPHILRNYFIKGVLKGGLNLRQAQLLARHSKIDVTKQYVAYFAHELKDSLDEANPLRGLL